MEICDFDVSENNIRLSGGIDGGTRLDLSSSE